jgi:hypothetical protein
MKTKKKKNNIKKILGVTTTYKNLMISIVLIFAFLGGFFQIYNWIDTTYAKQKHLERIEAKQELMDSESILDGMTTRYWTLDNMINMTPDPTKVPSIIRDEYNKLKDRIKLQQEKVRILQEKVCKVQ